MLRLRECGDKPYQAYDICKHMLTLFPFTKGRCDSRATAPIAFGRLRQRCPADTHRSDFPSGFRLTGHPRLLLSFGLVLQYVLTETFWTGGKGGWWQ